MRRAALSSVLTGGGGAGGVTGSTSVAGGAGGAISVFGGGAAGGGGVNANGSMSGAERTVPTASFFLDSSTISGDVAGGVFCVSLSTFSTTGFCGNGIGRGGGTGGGGAAGITIFGTGGGGGVTFGIAIGGIGFGSGTPGNLGAPWGAPGKDRGGMTGRTMLGIGPGEGKGNPTPGFPGVTGAGPIGTVGIFGGKGLPGRPGSVTRGSGLPAGGYGFGGAAGCPGTCGGIVDVALGTERGGVGVPMRAILFMTNACSSSVRLVRSWSALLSPSSMPNNSSEGFSPILSLVSDIT